LVKYLLTTKSPHDIPLKPLIILYPEATVDVANLSTTFKSIAEAILKLPEDDYILISAGLPTLVAFAALMLYQRFQKVKIAQFDANTRRYHIYQLPTIREFL